MPELSCGSDAAVGGVGRREARDREALDERLAVADARLVGVVGRRVAEQHDAAPQRDVGEPVLVERRQRRRGRRVVEEHVARIPCVGEAVDVDVVGDAVVVVVGRGGREDDRVARATRSRRRGLLGHDQRAGRADRRAGRHRRGARLAAHDRAGRDRQRRAVAHEDRVLHHDHAAPRRVRRDVGAHDGLCARVGCEARESDHQGSEECLSHLRLALFVLGLDVARCAVETRSARKRRQVAVRNHVPASRSVTSRDARASRRGRRTSPARRMAPRRDRDLHVGHVGSHGGAWPVFRKASRSSRSRAEGVAGTHEAVRDSGPWRRLRTCR